MERCGLVAERCFESYVLAAGALGPRARRQPLLVSYTAHPTRTRRKMHFDMGAPPGWMFAFPLLDTLR